MAAANTVELTSADRVLFPDDGITKGDLFEYYRAVAPIIVPHLKDRPFTMKRYPHGITGAVFFQQQAAKRRTRERAARVSSTLLSSTRRKRCCSWCRTTAST
ncbi:MAG: hypothetical protein E6G60_17105 [Actinobacteria bacterium]|nr:MAG: hypothetical protein E6G60_17105 [Actinomycetota bacterium]